MHLDTEVSVRQYEATLTSAELQTSLAYALSPEFSSCSSSCRGVYVAMTSAARGSFPHSWFEAWGYDGWPYMFLSGRTLGRVASYQRRYMPRLAS